MQTAKTKAPPRPQAETKEQKVRWNGPADDPNSLHALFTSAAVKKMISDAVPAHLTPERLLKVAVGVITKTPDLLQCTQISLLNSIIALAELGLEIGGGLGLAYLVPFKNKKTDKLEAQPIIGYRGYIELARRSGVLKSIEARVVHAKDHWRCRFGLYPKLEHIPSEEEDRGDILRVYVIARFGEGASHIEVMSTAEIEAIRQEAPSRNSPAWVNHWSEMAKKTVVRRAAKYLPLSPELAKAMEVDEGETVDGQVTGRGPTIDIVMTPPPPEPQSEKAVPALSAQTSIPQVIEINPPLETLSAEQLREPPPAVVVMAELDSISQEQQDLEKAIAAATTRDQLLALIVRIKVMPPVERETLARLHAEKMKGVR